LYRRQLIEIPDDRKEDQDKLNSLGFAEGLGAVQDEVC